MGPSSRRNGPEILERTPRLVCRVSSFPNGVSSCPNELQFVALEFPVAPLLWPRRFECHETPQRQAYFQSGTVVPSEELELLNFAPSEAPSFRGYLSHYDPVHLFEHQLRPIFRVSPFSLFSHPFWRRRAICPCCRVMLAIIYTICKKN